MNQYAIASPRAKGQELRFAAALFAGALAMAAPALVVWLVTDVSWRLLTAHWLARAREHCCEQRLLARAVATVDPLNRT